MKEFKVGDKVCDPILGLNGEVIELVSYDAYPVTVEFENGAWYTYTSGYDLTTDALPRLYHGHMEPGTAKITFEPKKEHVYEYQWLMQKPEGTFWVTGGYYTEAGVSWVFADDLSKPLHPIEESKRVR
jgi:hypothetical protein